MKDFFTYISLISYMKKETILWSAGGKCCCLTPGMSVVQALVVNDCFCTMIYAFSTKITSKTHPCVPSNKGLSSLNLILG